MINALKDAGLQRRAREAALDVITPARLAEALLCAHSVEAFHSICLDAKRIPPADLNEPFTHRFQFEPRTVCALEVAIERGTLEDVRLLVAAGADVNLEVARKRPIHAAAWRADPGVVLLLLEHGADPNCLDDKGYTPAHACVNLMHSSPKAPGLVVYDNTLKILGLLKDAGADLDALNDKGFSPLGLCALAEPARDLLELGANWIVPEHARHEFHESIPVIQAAMAERRMKQAQAQPHLPAAPAPGRGL